jgi:hypothetical protein
MTNIKKTKPQDLPFVLVLEEEGQGQVEQQDTPTEFQIGDICPVCRIGHLDYNSLLNLECAHCRYTLGGCFT